MSVYDRFKSVCCIDQNEFEDIKKEWSNEIVEIIENYEIQISMLKSTIMDLCGMEYIPSIANFRDALFHYRMAYTCDNLVTLIEQNNSIIEHLHRAVKDSISQVIRYVIECILAFYEKNLGDDSYHSENATLQTIIHELKRRELEIRLDSLEIKRPFESGSYLRETISYLGSVKQTLESNDYYKELSQKLIIG